MTADLRPYSGHKDSGVPWLGKVPEHWELLPAHAVYKPKLVKNVGMAEKTVLSLSYGRIIVKPEEKLHGLVPESFETYQIVNPGNIIVRTTDLQNDKTSLRIGHVKNRGIITSAYMCLETTERVLNEFGYQILNAYDLQKIIYGYGSGLRQNLEFSHIKRMPVPVPSLHEQAAIVRFIGHVDRRIRRYIRAKQKLIKLLEEQKQVIIHRAVTCGLDPNVRLKPSGVEWLGDVPEHWEVWQIGYFSRIGNGSTPSRGNSAYWVGGNFPWLNSSYANREFITSADQFVTDTALRECHLPIVPPSSVLVAITGQGKTRGKAALLLIEATINQHLAYITPRPELVSADYLRLVLHGAYNQLRFISDSSGSTKGALTCADLRHFRVAIPPISEQRIILNAVESEIQVINKAIDHIRREITLLQEYKTQITADVVTGKLDVREAAARLPEEAEEPEPLEDVDTEEQTDGLDDPDLSE
ncbi:MAG: restriction endonuclease subunit S, partial [Bacteroidota bacterium]